MMLRQTRRSFLESAALTAAALGAARGQTTPEPQGSSAPAGAPLRWLEGLTAEQPGTAWGVPWPRGTVNPEAAFALVSERGEEFPVQSWPLATWPDGTLKWSGHAVPAGGARAERLTLLPGTRAAEPGSTVRVAETAEAVEIDNGVLTVTIPKHGAHLIGAIRREQREIARHGKLVALRQSAPHEETGSYRVDPSTSEITSVRVEQAGPVRAVVKVEGVHRQDDGRAWLPFVVRWYVYSGAESVRMVHSFVFDGDEQRDFLRGLGVRFEVPLRDPLHDRHVRFSGEGEGLFAEAVRGLTGLRRDPGRRVRAAQIEGTATPPVEEWEPAVKRHTIGFIPAWGDYALTQHAPDAFEIRKRTRAGHAWIRAESGGRAPGLGYVGGPSGGLAFGQRFFWQRYPSQLEIRHAATDTAQVTNWLWSPDAPPMDLRFYHDGLGMETHREELDGLDITYEDYEKGFGTPHGIARTNELVFWAFAATPPRARFPELARALERPPLLAAAPEHLHAARVFGDWSLPDRSHPQKARIENQLDRLLEVYQKQIDQRRWYGFWDHGDVMHSYDADRHTWRYDVGGFAWANSELSPDLWLWYSFLRSGRADVFRTAEALTRHTGEVDVYHLGRFKGLGSRHNVQHWGCSCKQLRISTAVYRRFFYYLTADERTGDLLRELVDAEEAFLTLDPLRKVRPEPIPPPQRAAASVGVGTDWGSLASAWLTEWERSGDERMRDKLLAGMRTIAAQPHGFFAGGGNFNLDTGEFERREQVRPTASHLSAVFGLAEICSELIDLADVPGFEEAWLQYCSLFNAGREEQRQELGQDLGKLNLREAHSRLTAYAAHRRSDPALAARAWKEFFGGEAGLGVHDGWRPTLVEGPAVLRPVEESRGMNTNAASQWGLAAIQCLALIGNRIPAAAP